MDSVYLAVGVCVISWQPAAQSPDIVDMPCPAALGPQTCCEDVASGGIVCAPYPEDPEMNLCALLSRRFGLAPQALRGRQGCVLRLVEDRPQSWRALALSFGTDLAAATLLRQSAAAHSVPLNLHGVLAPVSTELEVPHNIFVVRSLWLRSVLAAVRPGDLALVVDSFDVALLSPLPDIVARWRDIGAPPVLFNAELFAPPGGPEEAAYPFAGPFPFLNAGVILAEAVALENVFTRLQALHDGNLWSCPGGSTQTYFDDQRCFAWHYVSGGLEVDGSADGFGLARDVRLDHSAALVAALAGRRHQEFIWVSNGKQEAAECGAVGHYDHASLSLHDLRTGRDEEER